MIKQLIRSNGRPYTWRPSNKPQSLIDEIELLWRAGGSIRGIAKKYGMSRTTVLRMVRSYGWERVVTEMGDTDGRH